MLTIESIDFKLPKEQDPYIKVKGIMFPRQMSGWAKQMTKREYERFLGETLLKQLIEDGKIQMEFKPEPERDIFTMLLQGR